MSAKSKIDDVKRHIDYAIRMLRPAQKQDDQYVRRAVRELEDALRDLDDARSKVSRLMQQS